MPAESDPRIASIREPTGATVQSLPHTPRVLKTDEDVTTIVGHSTPRRRESDHFRVLSREAERSPLLAALSGRQVVVVVMIVFVATALTLLTGPTTKHVRFAIFDVAVVAAAIYAGLAGGLFAILVGILVVTYAWLPPHGSLSLTDPSSIFASCRVRSRRPDRHRACSAIPPTDAPSLPSRMTRPSRPRNGAGSSSRPAACWPRRSTTRRRSRASRSSPFRRFADWCAVDLLVDGRIKRLAVAHADPDKDALDRATSTCGSGRPSSTIAALPPSSARAIRCSFRWSPTPVLEQVARSPEHLAQLRALGIHSAMIVPMTTRGMVLGALTLISSRPERRFTDADFNIAQALGRRAAVAIDNARLYRAARAANEVKTNFIATMSHELRTPLSAIIGFQELLADGVSGPVSEGQKQPLERIKASAMQLMSLIEEILLFARLDAGTETVTLGRFP